MHQRNKGISCSLTIVNLDWGWGGYGAFLDMIELHLDRSTGQGWVPLAFDSPPGCTDNYPRPSALTRRKYRGIYRIEDRLLGLWSEERSITVEG